MLDFSQRWTLWFESANHLGTWSAALLLIVVTLLIQPPVRSGGWRRIAFLILIGLLTLWFALLVAWSASRAAWIAVAIGFLVLVLVDRKRRTWGVVLAAIGIIAIGILSVDRVRDRALTVTELGQDGSSQSRPRTWGAACEMAAAHPWSGVGAGQFAYYYTNWYEPPERDDRLRTANNDLLHVMAERGAVVGVLMLTLYGLSMSLIRDGWKRRQMALIGLGLATGSFFVCGVFNNVITFGALLPWVLGVAGLSLVLVMVLNSWRVLLPCFLTTLSLAIVTVTMILLYGNARIDERPALLLAHHDQPWVIPTRTPISGTFIFVGEHGGRLRKIYREFLEPLSEQGWICLIVEPHSEFADWYHSIPPENADRPIIVMSLSERSTDLFAHLASASSRVTSAILCDNSFPEGITADQVSCPILFIHGRLSALNNFAAAAAFTEVLRRRWPTSMAIEVPWGSTWQRLVPHLKEQVADWLIPLRSSEGHGQSVRQ